MILWTVVLIIYGLIALVAVVMTFDEQCRAGRRYMLYNAAGYLACLLWPLPVAIILLSTVRQTT
jgi:hypothetical protein